MHRLCVENLATLNLVRSQAERSIISLPLRTMVIIPLVARVLALSVYIIIIINYRSVMLKLIHCIYYYKYLEDTVGVYSHLAQFLQPMSIRSL